MIVPTATSPGSGRPGSPAPKMGSQMMILLVVFITVMVIFTPEIRDALGKALGFVFFPAIGFGGSYPLFTLMIAGIIMIFLTTIMRHFFVDWVSQARNQKIISAFNKEFRDARQKNNTYKLKKLMEVQQEVMGKNFASMNTQMKLMPVTMIVIIPIFAWMYIFVTQDVTAHSFSMPWASEVDFRTSTIFPHWILVYSIFTVPFGMVLSRTLKYFSFRKKLRSLENGAKGAPNEADN